MENKQFYHLCGDGANSRNFITSLEDYMAAFNLVGVCAANTDVEVVSFSIEESHGHSLLWGTETNCLVFKDMFGTRDPRRLNTPQRVNLAQQLRRQYRMTYRQLATLVRLDEKELRLNVRT